MNGLALCSNALLLILLHRVCVCVSRLALPIPFAGAFGLMNHRHHRHHWPAFTLPFLRPFFALCFRFSFECVRPCVCVCVYVD
uniref:Secreted protein n=1 Tax=Anopheles darlingi TaxID=43151 RepID=A0A2M4DMY6_ANODA